MVFEDRVSENRNRKIIKIISQTPTEIVADIIRNDNGNGGTSISAKTFNDFQNEINNAKTESATALNISNAATLVASNADSKSDNAMSIANQANTKSDAAVADSNYAKTKADEVYAALAERGANVYVGNMAQAEIHFDSDPQTQLNSKLGASAKAVDSALLNGKNESQLTVSSANLLTGKQESELCVRSSNYCSTSVNLTGDQTISGEKTFGKITCTELNLIV